MKSFLFIAYRAYCYNPPMGRRYVCPSEVGIIQADDEWSAKWNVIQKYKAVDAVVKEINDSGIYFKILDSTPLWSED